MAVSDAPPTTYLGTRIARVDGPEKVTGQARFGDDLALYGLLHVRLVLGQYAHARIVKIDGSEALKQPGVLAVITADDLATLLKSPPTSRAREMLAKGETRYCGQPVAAVVAETEAAAEDAINLVEVEYEELPAVLDPLDALKPDAPTVWPDGVPGAKAVENGASDPTLQSPNLADHVAYDRGDIAAGFAEADVVVERSYRTSIVHQSYLEPHTSTSLMDPLGNLTVWSSTQGVFLPRQEIARALGLPEHRVKVVAPVLGGGFGGKGILTQPLSAALAIKYNRPVRVVYTRMDELQAANPAPRMFVDLKV